MNTVEVHLLTHDHEPMTQWAINHYGTFATAIILHHGGPSVIPRLSVVDGGGVGIEPWDTAGQLNDELACALKNRCWKGTTADWVIVADADELVYFPNGATTTLAAYEARGAAMIRPLGYEMYLDAPLPKITEFAQIYDHVKRGAPETKWYSKPVLFSPKRVIESGFGIGAHEAEPVFTGGIRRHVGPNWPIATDCLLLHCHQIGTLQEVADRYDATRRRLSAINVRNRWGNIDDTGLEHAQKKRDFILPNLVQVIP